jgi:uncharacterized caspase-like protein
MCTGIRALCGDPVDVSAAPVPAMSNVAPGTLDLYANNWAAETLLPLMVIAPGVSPSEDATL